MFVNRQLIYLFGAIFLITIPFTNCDTSNSGNGLFNTLTSVCQPDSSGYNPCVLQDPSTIQLQVNSGSLIQLPYTTTTAGGFTFDVGGDCNEGGYIATPGSATDQSYNEIHYSFLTPQGGVISQSDGASVNTGCSGVDTNGWLSGGPGNHKSACINGRFTVQVFSCVQMFTGYDYSLMISLTVHGPDGTLITDTNSVASTRTVTVRAASLQ